MRKMIISRKTNVEKGDQKELVPGVIAEPSKSTGRCRRHRRFAHEIRTQRLVKGEFRVLLLCSRDHSGA
jgi:hypothetical protein